MLVIDMYPAHSTRKHSIGTHGPASCGSPSTSAAATSIPNRHSSTRRRSV